jgi:hypothetical protein
MHDSIQLYKMLQYRWFSIYWIFALKIIQSLVGTAGGVISGGVFVDGEDGGGGGAAGPSLNEFSRIL